MILKILVALFLWFILPTSFWLILLGIFLGYLLFK